MRSYQNWTLFLDRDGVLNVSYPNFRILRVEDLKVLPEAVTAIEKYSSFFKHVIVLSNQSGVVQNLVPKATIDCINKTLEQELCKNGGSIDAFYYPYLKDTHDGWFKPSTGMAHAAKSDFPDIDFEKSIMIGDRISDMQFGRYLGMTTALIVEEPKFTARQLRLTDYFFKDLNEALEFFTSAES